MRRRKTSLCIAVALLIFGAAAAFPQDSTAPQQNSQPPSPAQAQAGTNPAPAASPGQPPIKSATRMVHVSVVVHDKHGNPIANLSKEDFSIFDEKKPQTIQAFAVAANDPSGHAAETLPANFYANRSAAGSADHGSFTVILLDRLNTPYDQQGRAKDQVTKFLEHVAPQDRVALYAVGQELKILQDFTNDSKTLLAALDRSPSEVPPGLAKPPEENAAVRIRPLTAAIYEDVNQRESVVLQEDRVQRTVNALTFIANRLGPFKGRKNLLWISASFPEVMGFDAEHWGALTNPTANFQSAIRAAEQTLTNADIAVYPIDTRGILSDQASISSDTNEISSPDPTARQTMISIADRTGGKAFYNTEDFAAAIRQAIDDSQVSYELGYYPSETKWDGSFRSIKVEVRVPDARVRARKGYFATPEPAITPETRHSEIATAAESPFDATGIGVKVQVLSADTAESGERTLKLRISFDLHDFSFAQSDALWRDNVDSVLVQLDEQNHVIDAIDQTMQLHFDESTYERLLQQGVFYTREITLKPSARTVRVLLRDSANGNIGDTSVPLAKYFPLN
jgi:VWFA-related protein